MNRCPHCRRNFSPPKKSPDQRFCGHRCAINFHRAKVQSAAASPAALQKRSDARRGRGKGEGYIKRNGRHEHRLVAEQKLGRPLATGEIAHHVDENKRNNAPDNIEVMVSQAEHARLHTTGRKRPVATHCKRGHEFTPDNTYRHPSGSRVCKTCMRAYCNDWQKRKRRARGLRPRGPRPGTPGANAISESNRRRSQQCV